MKRFWSLLLVLALLASIVVVPVSAETGTDSAPTLSFEIGTFTYDEKGMGSITLTEAKEKYQENDLVSLAIKITPDSVVRFFRGGTFFVNYDTSVFEPFTATSKYGVSAGPAYTTLANWSCEGGKPQDGVVSCAVGSGSGLVPLDPAEGTQLIFYFLFKVKQEVESATCEFTFHKDNEAKLVYTETINPKDPLKDILGVDYDTPKTSLTIEGKAPTLDSVTISPEATSVFASGKDFTLSAKSASGKDITSLVTFKIQKDGTDFSTGLTIAGSKLTVASSGSLANVGTYTVVATPNGDGCTGSASAVFTITPQTITNPTVTVSGFGKGLPVADAKATADNMTVARGWYTGEGVPSEANAATGNFAADSPYTLTLQLIPNKNYKLADDLTVTVKGLGADQVIEHASNPLIVKARTTAKDATSFKGNLGIGSSKTPCYGDTLSQIELNTAEAQAVAYVNGVETVIPGSFTWKDLTEKVGNAGDYRSHTVVFTPSGEYADLYEGFEKNISFYVQKKVLNISGLTWTWSNDTLTYTYTGEPQSIEMNIPTEIAEFVDVTYDNNGIYTNTATNAGSYTAAAVVTPKDANNISLGGATAEEQNSRTITKSWTINKADLTAADKIVEVRYGTGSKDLTLADLGLSALANEPGVDISFDVSGKGDVISSAGLTRDAGNKITGISITLSNTNVNDIDKTGSVKLTIKSSNYADKELTITVKIVNKDTKSLTIDGPASFPYGTTAETIKNALTVTGLPTGYDASKVTYTFSNSDISTAAPATGYTVTVGYEDAEFFYTGTHTFEVTARSIADADVTFKALTYNGSEQTTEITVKIGEKTLTMGKDYTVTGDLKGTNAGEYPVTVTGTGNYAGTLTPKFTIAKATPTADNFKVEVPTGVVYDGKAHPAIVTKLNNEIGIMTVLHNGDRALPKDAGEYTVTLDVAASDNYNAATGLTKPAWKFTIAKATPTLEIETAADATYTGQPYNEASKITLTSASNVSVNTYLYYSDKNCTVEANPVNVGTYWVKAKFNGDTNHNAVTSAAKQFNITKASYSLAIEAASVEYNKTPYSSSNIKVTPNLSVTFTYYSDAGCTNVLPTAPTEVGTYYVKANYAGTANYNEATSNVASFKIKKATPATPPEIKVDNTDTTLGELGNKMLVEIGVPGTIYWYGPDGKPITDPHTKIEANTEYRWTFIPADPDNYNSIEGKTTPYVRNDLSWLPGVLGGGSSFSFHDVTRFDYYYDSVKWAADNGIASGTSRFAFSPDAVCTRAQTVTFLWRAAGSPLPRYRVSPFTDVHSYDYYYEAVLWAVEQGITTGLTATTFGPDETVTRGQVATFLYRAASAAKPNTFNPFTDVKPTAYNYGAILWAYDNRITTGTSTTTFSPDAFCTRAQIVTFLYRYYQGR